MSTSINDDSVRHFVDVTGCDAAAAHFFLEAAGGDLDAAVETFLSEGLQQYQHHDGQRQHRARKRRRGERDAVSDDLPAADSVPDPLDGVRAPLPTIVDQLIGGPLPVLPPPSAASRRRAPVRPLASTSPRVCHSVDWKRDFLREYGRHKRSSLRQLQSLLTHPEPRLQFTDDFSACLQSAALRNRPILVFIFGHGDLLSLQLEQQLLSRPELNALIEERLIFKAIRAGSADDQSLRANCRVEHVPYLALVDGQTARELWHWHGHNQDPGQDHHEHQQHHTNNSGNRRIFFPSPSQPTKPLMDALLRELQHETGNARFCSTASSARIDTEEEESLRRAIQESLEEEEAEEADARQRQQLQHSQSPVSVSVLGHALVVEHLPVSENLTHVTPAPGNASAGATDWPLSAGHTLEPAAEPEPAAGAGVTRVQFRFPGGESLQRRFRRTAPVSELIHFVRASQRVPGQFQLVSRHPRLVLTEADSHDTLDRRQLDNCSILVELVDPPTNL